jgi:Retroviral aspartyl protease
MRKSRRVTLNLPKSVRADPDADQAPEPEVPRVEDIPEEEVVDETLQSNNVTTQETETDLPDPVPQQGDRVPIAFRPPRVIAFDWSRVPERQDGPSTPRIDKGKARAQPDDDPDITPDNPNQDKPDQDTRAREQSRVDDSGADEIFIQVPRGSKKGAHWNSEAFRFQREMEEAFNMLVDLTHTTFRVPEHQRQIPPGKATPVPDRDKRYYRFQMQKIFEWLYTKADRVFRITDPGPSQRSDSGSSTEIDSFAQPRTPVASTSRQMPRRNRTLNTNIGTPTFLDAQRAPDPNIDAATDNLRRLRQPGESIEDYIKRRDAWERLEAGRQSRLRSAFGSRHRETSDSEDDVENQMKEESPSSEPRFRERSTRTRDTNPNSETQTPNRDSSHREPSHGRRSAPIRQERHRDESPDPSDSSSEGSSRSSYSSHRGNRRDDHRRRDRRDRSPPSSDPSSSESSSAEYDSDEEFYMSEPENRRHRHRSHRNRPRRRRTTRRTRTSMPRELYRSRRTKPSVYEERELRRLRKEIKRAVGTFRAPNQALRAVKVSLNASYKGEHDVTSFDNWLKSLLRWLKLYCLTGRDNDSERLTILATTLSGQAETWYNHTLRHADRTGERFKFSDAVIGLYCRFIHPAAARKATEDFENCKYSRSDGVQGFFDNIMTLAAQMVEFPNDYTIARKFLSGLPEDITEHMMYSRNVSAEHTPLSKILSVAIQMECNKEFVKDLKSKRGGNTSEKRTHQSTSEEATDKPRVRFQSSKRRDRDKRGRFNSPRDKRRDDRRGGRDRNHSRKPDRDNRGTNSNDQAKDNSEVLCWSCGRKGHYSNDPKCPKYGSSRPRLNAQRVVDDSDEKPDQDHNATVEQEQQDDRDTDYESDTDSDENDEYYTSAEGSQFDPDSDDEETGVRAMRVVEDGTESDDSELEELYVQRFEKAKEKPILSREYQSNVHRKSVTGTRAKHLPATQRCLSTLVTFNGMKARALLDSGSTTDCVSPDLVRLADAETILLDEPVTLQLGCVGSRSKINYGAKCEIEIGGEKGDYYFDVVNLDKYDMIVGTPFLRRFGISLDFSENKIIMRGKDLPLFPKGEGNGEKLKSPKRARLGIKLSPKKHIKRLIGGRTSDE